MPRYHEAGDLAPRDVVSRAIVKEIERTDSEFVYLDMTGLSAERVRQRFPRIYATCLQYNLDIAADLIPVRPAAHYAMGGVASDLDGHTSLPGLYAAGEVACNGVHGANRLASNSLLEGLVYGARAGRAITQDCPAKQPARGRAASAESKASAAANPRPESVPAEVEKQRERIRATMWRQVGIIREEGSLAAAVESLRLLPLRHSEPPLRAAQEAENLRMVGEAIARCALAREESRGAHYRSDFPARLDEAWRKHSRLAPDGTVSFE